MSIPVCFLLIILNYSKELCIRPKVHIETCSSMSTYAISLGHMFYKTSKYKGTDLILTLGLGVNPIGGMG